MFEVGDKVECIRPAHNLTLGKIYKVSDVGRKLLAVEANDGEGWWYDPERFIEVVSPQ